MKVLHRVKDRRRLMLMGLAKADMLKGDFKRMLSGLGYDSSRRTLNPTRFKPPTDNTQDFMPKWVQVALNVILGTNLSIDGKLGPVTRQAIKRFQRQEGITSHGYVDDLTMQVLELRVGVQAPRHINHEAIPHLLMLPRRGIWKPRHRDKDRTKKRGKKEEEGPEIADPDAEVDTNRAHPGPLQTEAMRAVCGVAFDDEFIGDSAEELGRKDVKGLRQEIDGFVARNVLAPSQDVPDWLQRARDLARAHQEMAAGIIRRQWWSLQGGDESGD